VHVEEEIQRMRDVQVHVEEEIQRMKVLLFQVLLVPY
jgi:hypothetical protein